MTDISRIPPETDPLETEPLEVLEGLLHRVNRAISLHHHRARAALAEEERADLEAQGPTDRPAAEPRRRLQRRPRLHGGYRHPEDPNLTWPGLGRRPSWLHEALERGLTLDQLAIREDAPPPLLA